MDVATWLRGLGLEHPLSGCDSVATQRRRHSEENLKNAENCIVISARGLGRDHRTHL
jgi:hypothetical protein